MTYRSYLSCASCCIPRIKTAYGRLSHSQAKQCIRIVGVHSPFSKRESQRSPDDCSTQGSLFDTSRVTSSMPKRCKLGYPLRRQNASSVLPRLVRLFPNTSRNACLHLNASHESNLCRCVDLLLVHQCLTTNRTTAAKSTEFAASLSALKRTQMREQRVSAKTHIRTVHPVRVRSARSDEPRHLMHASAGASAARLSALEQPHRRMRCQRF